MRYRAYNTDESTGPEANALIVRLRSFVLHVTCGSGSASGFGATEVFTSFQVTSLPSV